MLWFVVVVAAQSAIAEHILESNSPALMNTCPTGRTVVSASSEYSVCELSEIGSSSSGGVFYSTSSVRIVVFECIFIGCYTTSGNGGVFYISTASLDINQCIFMGCSAHGSSSYAGVVYQTSASSSLSVTSSTADGCYAGYGGVFRIEGGNATVKDVCLFTGCYVERGSGAVIYQVASLSFVTIMNSILLNCKSKGTSNGGAVFIDYGSCRISHCEFENCESPRGGGAVYQCTASTELIISDCFMKRCIALCSTDTSNVWTGAAVGLEGGTTIIERTIFEACESSGSGGAIGTQSRNSDFSGTVLIRDCEMIDCKASEYGGALYFAKSGFSLTLDRFACFACYGSGTKGLSIYISSISEFKWTNLCVQGSGSLVYSVKNQPSSSDLNQECFTDPFTASVFPITRSRKSNYVVVIYPFQMFVHV